MGRNFDVIDNLIISHELKGNANVNINVSYTKLGGGGLEEGYVSFLRLRHYKLLLSCDLYCLCCDGKISFLELFGVAA